MEEELQRQWAAMSAAPFLFWGAVIVGWLAIWAIVHFLYRNRIDGLKEELDRERRENTRLKENAASPRAVPLEPPKRKAAAAKLPLPNEEPILEERVDLGPNITPPFLRSHYLKLSAHQADKAVKPYLGKWLQTKGAIENIYQEEDGWTIALQSRTEGEVLGSVMANFNLSEGPKIEALQIGDEITVEGKVTLVEPFWVTLKAARLVGHSE